VRHDIKESLACHLLYEEVKKACVRNFTKQLEYWVFVVLEKNWQEKTLKGKASIFWRSRVANHPWHLTETVHLAHGDSGYVNEYRATY
jgi:hypothetical protein